MTASDKRSAGTHLGVERPNAMARLLPAVMIGGLLTHAAAIAYPAVVAGLAINDARTGVVRGQGNGLV